MDGLHDDFCQLIVCLDRGGQSFFGGAALEGQGAVVIKLIQNHAQGVGIHSHIHGSHGIKQFRRRINAVILLRQGCVTQGVQGQEAQVANAVFFLVGQENVGGLQIHIQGTGLPTDGQRIAHIQTQIHRFQMGNRIVADIPL